MKLTKALGRLGPAQALGITGSDWSWYYQWGKDTYGDTIVVNEDNEPMSFTYSDLVNRDWVIKDKSKIPRD